MYTPICAAITSAATESASLHHLRTRCIMLESFAEYRGNRKRFEFAIRSVNGAQHTAPTRALRQVKQRIHDALQPLKKAGLAIVRAIGFHGPVDQERPT